MKFSRSSRLVAALLALVSMLFMQFAVAGYACPGYDHVFELSGKDSAAAMPECSEMDDAQPSLCHAYNHTNKHSLDKPGPPDVQPFHAAGLVFALNPPETASHLTTAPQGSFPWMHAAAPPLLIRNCCLRI